MIIKFLLNYLREMPAWPRQSDRLICISMTSNKSGQFGLWSNCPYRQNVILTNVRISRLFEKRFVKSGLFIFLLFFCTTINSFSQLFINEILATNASVNYDRKYFNFSSWIEIYNSGAVPVNLSGYYISDRSSIPDKWMLPDTSVQAGSYLLIWADGNEYLLHSSFNLNVDGEFVGLYNPSKQPVDSITFPKQHTNISYGRSPDGTSAWKYFVRPTPGSSNTTNTASAFTPQPQFSLKGGFYSGNQNIVLTNTSPTAKIYYTTDGSEPADTSALYAAPLAITINTVIRSRACDAGFLPSDIITHTFFINENSTVPVISLVVPPEYLYDDSIGIYTVGVNGIGSPPKNYRCPWERPANVEYFISGDTAAFNIYCGVETFGLQSRGYAQKSLEVKFDEKYGRNKIIYTLFKNRSYNNLHGFIARNSGTDWKDGGTDDACGMMFRDGLLETFPQGQMDIDLMAYQPAISFLNGQYWGIVDIREKLDKYFCNNLFESVDKDCLDIIKQSVTTPFEVQEGDSVLMKQFFSFIKTNNMADPANYQKAKDSIDIREFINYIIVETYSNNMDWIFYNVKFWRQPGVIKWRWMLFDIERGFNGMGMAWNSVAYNRLRDAAAADTNTKNHLNQWTGIFLGSLLKNTGFRNEFAQTYAAHMNTTYLPGRINKIIDSLEAIIQPEIQRHIDKWAAQGSTQSMSNWNKHVQWTHDFANQRQPYAWSHIKSVTGLSAMANVKISKTFGSMGKVYIQGATMYDSIMKGPYFNNIPVELKAVANSGFVFNWWEKSKGGVKTYFRPALINDVLNSSGVSDSIFYTARFTKTLIDSLILTVNGGSGSGLYASSTVVNVKAAAAPAGKVFDKWTGDVSLLANEYESAATLTMPSADVSITATYKTVLSVTAYNKDEFTIYPNPVSDELTVLFNVPFYGTISIIDLTGKTLLTAAVASDCIKINVQEIPSGIFMVLVKNDNVCTVRKFIKN